VTVVKVIVILVNVIVLTPQATQQVPVTDTVPGVVAVAAGVVNVLEFKEPNTLPPQHVSLRTPQYAGHSEVESPSTAGVNDTVAVKQLALQAEVPATHARPDVTAVGPAPTTTTLIPEPLMSTQKEVGLIVEADT
jgi:hypothetical protein